MIYSIFKSSNRNCYLLTISFNTLRTGRFVEIWQSKSKNYMIQKTQNVPSNHWHGASVTKYWLPFELGPLFAMDTTPAPVCFNSGWISSSNIGLWSHQNKMLLLIRISFNPFVPSSYSSEKNWVQVISTPLCNVSKVFFGASR